MAAPMMKRTMMDTIGANDDGEENEEREAYIDMLVEMKKRKNLEGVLNRLQKKKNKMDEVLKELLHQQQEQEQQRVKMNRYNLNCNLQSSRYEADGSEEDEIGVRSNSIKANLMNNYATDQGLCGKLGELEQLEANLKQVELQIRNLTTRDPDELMEMQEMYNHQRKREKARKAYNDDQINERVTSNQSSHRNDRSNALDGRKASSTSKRNDTSQHRAAPISFDDGNRRTLGLSGIDSLNNSMIDSNRPEASTPASEDSLNDIEANLQLRDPFMLRNFFQNETSDQNTLSHHQFFHLMLTQNYQILQQQQMLLLWLQQQTSHNHPPTCCRNCESVIGISNFSPPPLAVWTPFTGQLSASNQASTSHLERNRAISSFGRLPDPNESSTSPIACGKAAPGVRPNAGSGENSKNNVPQNQLSSNEGSSSRSCFSKTNGNLSGNSPHHRVGQNFNLHYSALSGIRSMDNGAQESLHSFPSNANKSNPVRKSSYPGSPSDHGMRKIKNTPLNDIHPPRCMPNGMRVGEKSKFMSSEKRDMSPSIHTATSTSSVGSIPQTRVKSSNIPLSQIEDVAIGGDERQLNEDVDHMAQSSGPGNVRPHPITLHISPSTGAIRKKLRNPDVIESASSKSDKKDDPTFLLSETTRPLMAAEGRSSETNRLIVNGAPSMAPVKTTQASLLRLRQRPPTTGATSPDENEESISSSADDDLAEADQTAIELTESENLHSSSNMMGAMQGIPVANICDSSNKVEPKSAEGEGGDTEDNEDDQVSGRSADESGIRFSGDGEQGA